jgi:hypothetical protein
MVDIKKHGLLSSDAVWSGRYVSTLHIQGRRTMAMAEEGYFLVLLSLLLVYGVE